MVLKTLYTTLLSFLLTLIEVFIFGQWNALNKGTGFDISLIAIILFYSIPILALGFVVLLADNIVLDYLQRRGIKIRRTSAYLLSGFIPVIVIFSFIVFDYMDRGRFFENKTFVSITGEYGAAFLWTAITLLLNWKLLWSRNKGDDKTK